METAICLFGTQNKLCGNSIPFSVEVESCSSGGGTRLDGRDRFELSPPSLFPSAMAPGVSITFSEAEEGVTTYQQLNGAEDEGFTEFLTFSN